jgi:hypothetical protein
MSVPKVFISHSSSDKDWARKFAETLEHNGLEVWIDESRIKGGQAWVEALENGLRESDAVVLLISPDNINRPNLFFEIGAALGMNKAIIPVIPKDFDSHKLPLPLQRIKFLIRNSPEDTAKELATAIESLAGEAA